MPGFTLDVNGKAVTFQPVCQTSTNFSYGTNFSGSGSDCTLTNVKIDDSQLVYDTYGKIVQGSLLFTWEDSLWGNDYDYDASSRIKFCVGKQCNLTSDDDLKRTTFTDDELRIAVQVDGVYAGLNMRFSYTITGVGVGNDGLQTDYVYKERYTSSYPAIFKPHNYTASGVAAGVLSKPMLLAAKYGGFTDLDGDGTPGHDANGNGGSNPDDHREWDNRNNSTGALGSDNVPDNYFFSRNPSLLETQLDQVLSDISSRVASATNAALLANSSNGTGTVYQALFQPEREVNGKTVQWGGILHALFIDSKGHLREDSNNNDQLDDYSTDKIVELFFDPNAGQTMVQRYISNDEGITKITSGALSALSSLETIWDGRKQLSEVANVISQRTYNALASGGRHILTWLDKDNNQQIDTDEFLPFMPSTFINNEGYLGVNSTDVSNLVNYIRGEEQTGARNRTIDFDEDGHADVWRLGDIIHSTPRLVAAPDSRFDAHYGDTSYQLFRTQYANRRHMLYVGANDGLIHAFNGGFWSEADYAYERSGDNNEALHPLGSELWAYAPMNLLPHLQWLREVDYPHVYYMDGEPLVFDANIFADDTDHPGGWGTVLVMGMRLGGGSIDISVEGTTRTMRSSYVVLDVTNPEEPPELLAEITHPDLGFTSSQPEVIKVRKPDTTVNGDDDWGNPLLNDWYLVFGSGPGGSGVTAIRDALDDGKSTKSLSLFVYDLNNKALVSGLDPLMTNYSNSYSGNIAVADWDRDYQDDSVYFGSVDTGGTNLSGRLMRLKINSPMSNSMLDVFLESGQPIVSTPLTVADKNNYWVYSGTGRLLTTNDNRDASVNYFYGIQEPLNSTYQFTYATVNASDLIDTTEVEVLTDGTVRTLINGSYQGFSVGESVIDDFASLKQTIKNQPGWKRVLNYDGINPSGRNINKASQLFTSILFSEYQPPKDSCSVDGSSFLHAVHYLTGTASSDAVLGSLPLDDMEAELAVSKISLGLGYASSPVIHRGTNSKLSAVTQGAGGSITRTELKYGVASEGRQSWWQIFTIPWVD